MRISIIILSYNYESFLEAAIRSALDQRYPDTEVIVVDDGSTDGSREIIERWRERVIAVLKPNGGQPSAYNAGFERASGDVVLFLDADDCLDPSACQEIARAFSQRVVKVHFRLRMIDGAGQALGGVVPARLSEGDLRSQLLAHGKLHASSPGSGNAYRKRALARLMPLPFDPGDPLGADFFAIYGISLLGEVRTAARHPLGSYRIHRMPAGSQVVFGNCAHDFAEPYATYRRYARMREWLVARLGSGHRIADCAPDFSLEKQGYAAAVFDGRDGYLTSLRRGGAYLARRMIPAIRDRSGSSLSRVALAGWAVAVLVLPRTLGLPIARYVCNPATR